MIDKTKKDNFGSQCLKEVLVITKKKCAETQHPRICSYICYQLGRISFIMRDFIQAKTNFTQANDIAALFFDNYFMMKCSEWIGRTLSILKQHKNSIEFFSTVLHLAWAENNLKYENKAYDHLGLQHFYLGNIDTAKKFHTKMVEGQFESQNSEMRMLTKDLLNKKENFKKNYYDSRDKLLRYQITSQIIVLSHARSEEITQENKFLEENVLPPVESVIQPNRNSENTCQIKAVVTTEFFSGKDFGASYKEAKVTLQIKDKKFEMKLFSDDPNQHMFKNIFGYEDIEILINLKNTIITKILKVKDMNNETGKLNYQVDLSQTGLGLNG